jgi:hypothetical protein
VTSSLLAVEISVRLGLRVSSGSLLVKVLRLSRVNLTYFSICPLRASLSFSLMNWLYLRVNSVWMLPYSSFFREESRNSKGL